MGGVIFPPVIVPGRSVTINQVGHSMAGGQSGYMPIAIPPNVPPWVAGASVTVGQVYSSGAFTYRVSTAGTNAATGSGPGTSVGLSGSLAGGSGYTAGTYTNVSLTGGTGSGATATVVVTGSAVTSITLSSVRGSGYSVGDTLSPDTTTGGMGSVGTGSSIKVTSLGTYSGAVANGSAAYTLVPVTVQVFNTAILHWVEAWAPQVRWNMEAGYAGVLTGTFKVWVSSPGTSYAPGDTWSSAGGASGGLVVDSAGRIVGATITNPGYLTNITGSSISTATGSGGALRLGVAGSGTFGLSGALTSDVVYLAADAAASAADIILAGPLTTNDSPLVTGAGNLATQFAATVANLATIYNTLLSAGKKVVVVIDPPRAGVPTIQNVFLRMVANWQRAFVASRLSTPLSASAQIAIVDPSVYATDGTSSVGAPIGGSSGLADAMTRDGLHQSQRLAQYYATLIISAIERWISAPTSSPVRGADMVDGADSVLNPGGNRIEALPWQPSATVQVNQTVSNGGNVYYYYQAGTTASSGGPTGTTTGTDGTAKYNWTRPVGCSVFAGPSTSLSGVVVGVTAGVFPLGWTLSRSGSATGTVTGAIENPWSNGQVGQRFSLTFSLGSGTSAEVWSLSCGFNAKSYGILASDMGVISLSLLVEMEVTGQQNLQYIRVGFADTNSGITTDCGLCLQDSGAGGHLTEAKGSGEMVAMPVKRVLRTPPVVVPAAALAAGSFVPVISIGLDASGAAGSATAVVRFNYAELRQQNVF